MGKEVEYWKWNHANFEPAYCYPILRKHKRNDGFDHYTISPHGNISDDTTHWMYIEAPMTEGVKSLQEAKDILRGMAADRHKELDIENFPFDVCTVADPQVVKLNNAAYLIEKTIKRIKEDGS